MLKCLIIGGGPAGYTAAIYAGRAGLQPVLVEGPEPGGQLTATSMVENYPGFASGIDAQTLMAAMRSQAEGCGADIRAGIAGSADLQAHKVTLDNGETLEARTIIIATGASARWLGLESERRLRGLGVSACATCDGFFFRGREVAVIGGGDSACEEALYLSGLASKVRIIVRKPQMRASEALKAAVAKTGNIEVHYGCVPVEMLGDETSGLTGIRLDRSGEIFDMKTDGVFVAIGRNPNTAWLAGQLPLDASGYIVSDGVRTGVPGVFVAGDVRATDYRQAVTAAADGCRAALESEKYLKNI